MGREARVEATIGAERGSVTVLLESDALILRGGPRRRWRRDAIRDIAVDGDGVTFQAGTETVRLAFPPGLAANWAKAMTTPPSSLAAKLGLSKGARALLVGPCHDTDLLAALDGATAVDPVGAALAIAVVETPEALAAAVAASGRLPLWVVHPKGRGVVFGDTAIRAEMRRSGYRDAKACAVSQRLTATRYDPA